MSGTLSSACFGEPDVEPARPRVVEPASRRAHRAEHVTLAKRPARAIERLHLEPEPGDALKRGLLDAYRGAVADAEGTVRVGLGGGEERAPTIYRCSEVDDADRDLCQPANAEHATDSLPEDVPHRQTLDSRCPLVLAQEHQRPERSHVRQEDVRPLTADVRVRRAS